MTDAGRNDMLAAWDRDCLLHPTTHTAQHARGDVPGRIITGGEGCFVEDRDGNVTESDWEVLLKRAKLGKNQLIAVLSP